MKNTQTDIQKRIELVTQIETLKKQLGWSFKDETSYVKACFNKAYRAFLNLEELQQYLNYLELQCGDIGEQQAQNQLSLFD